MREKLKLNFFFFHVRSNLAIAEASKETYPDEESLSGSVLSLAQSNSSCSFPDGNL